MGNVSLFLWYFVFKIHFCLKRLVPIRWNQHFLHKDTHIYSRFLMFVSFHHLSSIGLWFRVMSMKLFFVKSQHLLKIMYHYKILKTKYIMWCMYWSVNVKWILSPLSCECKMCISSCFVIINDIITPQVYGEIIIVSIFLKNEWYQGYEVG